ncbi:MAG: HAD hydrolase-like protein [Gemmatimonadales bacterium]
MLSTLVLFDIDGTILLTAGAGRRAITQALGDLIGTSDLFDRVRFDGKTDPQIVSELLEAGGHHSPRDATVIDTICQRYLGLLAAELLEPRSRTTIMPGVLELLTALEAEPGVMLGLVTGNMAPGACLKLQAGGIAPERFKVGAYGSDSAHRPDLPMIAAGRAAPHFGRMPRGREVVIIGDTPADVTCGRSIDARAIGVATGAYSVAVLAEAGAHLAVADLSDTARLVEVILGE